MERETVKATTKPAGAAERQRRVWLRAQREYAGWTNQWLPPHYINSIIRLGEKFCRFIGRQGRCLDVGCGNGIIAGKTYKDVGYKYLKKGAVVGVDPLVLQGPKQQWLTEYVRGVCEHLHFRDEVFDTVVFATTLDHVENVDETLQECRRVLKRNGTLNIWLTTVFRLASKLSEIQDKIHPNRFTYALLLEAVTRNGFHIVDRHVEPWIGISKLRIPVSSGNTVFLKACKGGD